MTKSEFELIQDNFAKLAPSAHLIGDAFHDKLQETAPDIAIIFSDYFNEHGNKFQIISEIVNRHLRSLLFVPITPDGQRSSIPPAVYKLGQLHAKYAITRDQFAKMKEVLLWTLEQFLSSDFSPETREAWSRAYDNLAEMMQRAMTEEEAQPAAFRRTESAPIYSSLEDALMSIYGRIHAD